MDRLTGIIPPLVTPLNANETLDLASTDCLLDHVITGGVHGVFILGTTGEGPNLSYAQRRDFIDHVCKAVNRRVAVIVSVSDTAYTESIALANYAAKAGADAVAFTPPYYFIPGAPELKDYVNRMAESLPLPFFFYNMPALTKISVPLDVIETAFQHENCLGIKDSSGDLFYYKKVRRLIGNRDLTLLLGPEELLAESLLAGGNGGINGGANAFPKLYVKIYELANAGQYREAAELQREVIEISSNLFTIGKHGSSIIKGIKGTLEILGIAKSHMAMPFRGFNAEDLKRVANAITLLKNRQALLPYL
jgi:4-hydroxy-tetrahydrodipicolinate synthase